MKGKRDFSAMSRLAEIRLGSFRRDAIRFAVLLGFVLTAQLSAGSDARRNHGITDQRCSEVNQILESKVADILSVGASEAGVCSRNSGSVDCCSERMERQLVGLSRKQVNKILSDKMQILKQTFTTWTAKFDRFFIELIERSKKQLHDTFERDHAAVFPSTNATFFGLYRDLAIYYKSSDMDFSELFDRFFETLFLQLFAHFNDHYLIGGDFLECLVEHVETLRTFDPFPGRLAWLASRTVLFARTFVRALSEGKASVLVTIKQPADDRCLDAMTQTLHCSLCRGLSSAKPCVDHCVRTASKCLRLQMELLNDWNAYLELNNTSCGGIISTV